MTLGTPPVAIHDIRHVSGSGLPFGLPQERQICFERGRFAVVLGQNGSGKTTFLEAILGIRPDYEVRREILGCARMDLPNAIKRRVGVSTQVHSYSEGVKVRDVVRLHAGAYGVEINSDLLDAFDLTKALDSPYAKTSGGQKKRLSLYFALAHDPEVAFLDEPEAGLDVQGLEALLARVRDRSAAGRTTVAATHHGLTTGHASDVVFLNAGDIAFAGEKTRFIDEFFGDSVLEVNTDGLSEQDIERISNIGKAKCFDGISKDKLLMFGSEAAFADLRQAPELGIGQRSILRDTRPSDMLTWINNRTATKCVP